MQMPVKRWFMFAEETPDPAGKEPLRKVNDSIKDLLSGIRVADLVEKAEPHETASGAPVGGGLVTIAM